MMYQAIMAPNRLLPAPSNPGLNGCVTCIDAGANIAVSRPPPDCPMKGVSFVSEYATCNVGAEYATFNVGAE